MVTAGEDEGVADLVAEFEEVALGPGGLGLAEVGHDVGVVPEEVVGDALLEEGRVAEDREELTKLVEVLWDAATVGGGGWNVIDELLDVEHALGYAPEAARGEVGHGVLNVGDKRLSAVHAPEKVVEVVLVDDAVHDTGEDLDDGLGGDVLGLRGSEAHGGGAQHSQDCLLEHHLLSLERCIYI